MRHQKLTLKFLKTPQRWSRFQQNLAKQSLWKICELAHDTAPSLLTFTYNILQCCRFMIPSWCIPTSHPHLGRHLQLLGLVQPICCCQRPSDFFAKPHDATDGHPPVTSAHEFAQAHVLHDQQTHLPIGMDLLRVADGSRNVASIPPNEERSRTAGFYMVMATLGWINWEFAKLHENGWKMTLRAQLSLWCAFASE